MAAVGLQANSASLRTARDVFGSGAVRRHARLIVPARVSVQNGKDRKPKVVRGNVASLGLSSCVTLRSPPAKPTKERRKSFPLYICSSAPEKTRKYEAIPVHRINNFEESNVRHHKPFNPPRVHVHDASVHNPLERQNRLGCGWIGAIFEYDGVLVNDTSQVHMKAWLTLAEEEGRPPPAAYVLRRCAGMKSEQVVSEVLCWSRDPSKVRALAARKEATYERLMDGQYVAVPGMLEFLENLQKYDIPCAIGSPAPRRQVELGLASTGLDVFFRPTPFSDVIVTAEDVHRSTPDTETYLTAASCIKRPPERCIVFGAGNASVEAARDCRMKVVTLASRHPLYELTAADLAVRHVAELSVANLRNLVAAAEPGEDGEPETQMEMEEEAYAPKPLSMLFDD